MKFKVDENMPEALPLLLRGAGHDVRTVVEEALGGRDDPEVIDAARSEHRILMTYDTDFGNIRRYPLGSHAGIVVFRLRDQRWKALQKPATSLVTSGYLDQLNRGLAIVEETRVRLRRPAPPSLPRTRKT